MTRQIGGTGEMSYDWSNTDWSKRNVEIALAVGCGPQTVAYQRKKLGKANPWTRGGNVSAVEAGDKFNALTAIAETGRSTRMGRIWQWRCDCGKVIEKLGTQVKRGNPRSCGCLPYNYKTVNGVRQLPNRMNDEARRLPPDEKGRKRYVDKHGTVLVSVGCHHPLSYGNGYVREARLKAFESGVDPRGKCVADDGSVFNTKAELRSYLRPRLQRYCRCGCGGEVDSALPKYLPGHRPRKNAAFEHLPVSRERKRQLRRISEGKCVRACDEPLFASGMCKKHLFECREKAMLRRRGGTSKNTKWNAYLRGEPWVPTPERLARERLEKLQLKQQRIEQATWRSVLRKEPEYFI